MSQFRPHQHDTTVPIINRVDLIWKVGHNIKKIYVFVTVTLLTEAAKLCFLTNLFKCQTVVPLAVV